MLLFPRSLLSLNILQVDGKVRWLVPMFCAMLTDWPEGQAATCVRAGATVSKRNCRVCLCPTAEFNQTERGVCYRLREQADMRRRAEWHNHQMDTNVRGSFGTAEEEGLDLSMWWTPSAMWKLESYTDSSGYFMQFPFDTLHTVSAGLGLMLKRVLMGLSVLYKSGFEMDARLGMIPVVRDAERRNLSYRTFPTGIQDMQKFTGGDIVALLQQMQYAVSTDNAVIEDPAIRQAFIKACTAVRTILQFMKQRSLTEADTVALHRRCMSIGPLFRQLMAVIPADEELNLDIPKIHACIHFAAFIRMFGCGMNFDTSTNERLHKEVVGNVLAQDCRRSADRLQRMLALMNMRTLLKALGAHREGVDVAHLEEARVANQPVVMEGDVGCSLPTFIANWENAEERVILQATFDTYQGGALRLRRADQLRVYKELVLDFGGELVRFVHSPNYRLSGLRSDPVAVRTELVGRGRGQPRAEARPWPVEVVAYFGDGAGSSYALVRQYVYLQRPHQTDFEAALMRKSLDTEARNYSIVEANMVAGHAHMIPIFTEDGPDPSICFYDDLMTLV